MPKPESVYLVLKFADGTVGIMSFVTKDDRGGWERLATTDNVESDIRRTELSLSSEKVPVRSWHFVDEKDIPQDRTYRNALRHDPVNGFSHDMAHARELHRQALRAVRSPLFAQLDAEYMKADESGDVKAKDRITLAKQALRDAPQNPSIELANSVDELKAVRL